MMGYIITNCCSLGPRQLCAAMNAAFSDYVVPLSLTLEQFEHFQWQRGFVAAQSFVALEGDDIAAFWFSGLPDPHNGNRAYTLSVGTRPEHRRNGLSRRLLNAVVDAQSQHGTSGLQLEVITSNSAAISSYESFGFCRHRSLRVLKLETEPSAAKQVHPVRPLDLSDLPESDTGFFDAAPTPQNSRTALRALTPDFQLLGVKENAELLGWGAVYPDGAVAQMAVAEKVRRQGIGSAILRALWHAADQQSLTFVNVDAAATGVNAFLDRAGAEELLRQYEMRLDLT
ncbi:GNAT family N-acetyltransferase [Roseibium sediminicola]|uniref:GNAT family N-acetyltransferase n=1 Tax=Roseibium sediminicola TaxID=2933272 RepID=A0ABT0H165_9HYPH|nr:GNAT family N-acetyltransferase [Roseibium sp. CAU 1639]MCK7614815.1 GNAT family N-acetyltransferase [Roseibium sp. CAU 1639]